MSQAGGVAPARLLTRQIEIFLTGETDLCATPTLRCLEAAEIQNSSQPSPPVWHNLTPHTSHLTPDPPDTEEDPTADLSLDWLPGLW